MASFRVEALFITAVLHAGRVPQGSQRLERIRSRLQALSPQDLSLNAYGKCGIRYNVH